MKETKRISLDIDGKSLTDDGSFDAYASVFNNTDLDNEMVMPGAFKKSLRQHKANETMPALLYQHDHTQVLGIVENAKEDDYGLKVQAKLNLDTQLGKETYSLLKMGALKTMSFGFARKQWEDSPKGPRKLIELDLYEVSLVTFPANPKAKVVAVKDKLKTGELPTIREFENLLTVEGFSRGQAIQIINEGYKSLVGDVMRDADDQSELKDLSDRLNAVVKRIKEE